MHRTEDGANRADGDPDRHVLGERRLKHAAEQQLFADARRRGDERELTRTALGEDRRDALLDERDQPADGAEAGPAAPPEPDEQRGRGRDPDGQAPPMPKNALERRDPDPGTQSQRRQRQPGLAQRGEPRQPGGSAGDRYLARSR
jgi:hypothetical protein